jgi:hydroxymethylbilane synthase
VVDGEDGPELSVRAVVAAVDGSVALRRSLTGPVDDPVGLGDALAAMLAEDGAADLVPPRLRTSIDPAESHPADPHPAGLRPAEPRPAVPPWPRADEPRTSSTTEEGDQ